MRDPVRLIQQVIDDINRDYENEIGAAREKRDARFRELDEIFEGVKKSRSVNITATASITAVGTVVKGSKRGFAQAVRDIVEETDKTFDKNYIEKQMKDRDPDLAAKLGARTVPIILMRLHKDGKIVEVKKGTGRKPSKFRKSTY